MSVNKVQLANGETIIDISDSTVTPETLAEGVTAHDASGQKITGKMIPGGGTSVQTDWNQTDETAPDFLKNKPFGDVVTEIMPETEIVGEDAGDGIYATPFNAASFPGTEETLTVTFDGVKYICSNVGSIYGLTIFGNMGLAGEMDTGEPFMIDPLGAISGEPIIIVADTERHTIGIQSTSIEKLDAKYVTNFASFYIAVDYDTNPYIYTDIYLSNKVTTSDLINAAMTQVIQVFALIGTQTYIKATPLVVNWIVGFIEFRGWRSTSSDFARVYTAEYTPPTT